jgi:hypothetical protein
LYSKNLRGKDTSLKLNSTDSMKVWWMPVLVRGKLHVVMLPESFPGECPEGATVAIAYLPGVLNVRFRDEAKPRHVMTDRGKGFYTTVLGNITPEYARALQRSHLRPFMGENALVQPGQLQEMMLHETSVSWIRRKLEVTLPSNPWEETRQQYEARLKDAVRQINESHDVAGLTHEFPDRIARLIATKGDRLAK